MKQSAILLVEDEVLFRSSLARGLSKLPNLSVTAVGTVDEALYFIKKVEFDLIISDINLPEKTGLELFDEISKMYSPIPIILMTGYLSDYQNRLANHPFIDVIEKPVKLSFIRGLVQDRINSYADIKQAPPFSAGDYLQLAAFGRHSVSIISYFGGRKIGEITVHQGQVWRAEDVRGGGREAFGRLVSLEGAHHVCETLTSAPGERNLSESWEFLLLDAARAKDEQHALSTGEQPTYPIQPLSHDDASPEAREAPSQTLEYPPTPQVQTPPPEEAFETLDAIDLLEVHALDEVEGTSPSLAPETKSFAQLIEEGIDALLVRDYRLAWRSFRLAELLQPNDPLIKMNLQRLKELGFGDPE